MIVWRNSAISITTPAMTRMAGPPRLGIEPNPAAAKLAHPTQRLLDVLYGSRRGTRLMRAAGKTDS